MPVAMPLPSNDSAGKLGGPVTSPLVSVVVPVFRVPESFLRANAISLRGQSFQNAEFLYVLDGPDPGALALLQDIFRGDHRFAPVVLPENRGVSVARNTALERARGSFVTFVDADDLLPPGALSAYARATEDAPDLVIGPTIGHLCSPKGRRALFSPPPSAVRDVQWARFHVWANSSVWARLYGPAIRACRFDPGVRLLEDARFLWSHLASLPSDARVVFLDVPVYSVVPRQGSASRSPVSAEDLCTYYDSLALLAQIPLPAGSGPETRRIRGLQLLLWAFVDARRAPPEAWSAAFPHACGFIETFLRFYSIPLLLRPLVHRRLSSPAALASPLRIENILLWDVVRWQTRTDRAEPLLLSLCGIACSPLYHRLVSAFHPLPRLTKDSP